MSVTHLDPTELIFDINQYRIKNLCYPVHLSGYLQKQCQDHTRRVINNETGFGCTDAEITQRAGSSLFFKLDEFCAKIHYTEPIFDNLIRNDNIESILNYPFANVIGISMFSCGNYIYVFAMMGETK